MRAIAFLQKRAFFSFSSSFLSEVVTLEGTVLGHARASAYPPSLASSLPSERAPRSPLSRFLFLLALLGVIL